MVISRRHPGYRIALKDRTLLKVDVAMVKNTVWDLGNQTGIGIPERSHWYMRAEILAVRRFIATRHIGALPFKTSAAAILLTSTRLENARLGWRIKAAERSTLGAYAGRNLRHAVHRDSGGNIMEIGHILKPTETHEPIRRRV